MGPGLSAYFVKGLAASVTAAGCMVGVAAAQPGPSSGPDGQSAGRLYVKGGVGAVFVRDLDQDLALNPDIAFPTIIAPPTQRLTAVENGVSAAAAVGFGYPSGTRTELEYRYSAPLIPSVSSISAVNSLIGAPEGGVGNLTTHLLFSNAYYDFKNTSPVTPFIGFGVGGAFVSNGLGQSDAAFAYQAKAGIEASLSETLSLGVEYSYARSRQLVFGPSDDDFTADGPVGPRADGDQYVASTVLFTIRKSF